MATFLIERNLPGSSDLTPEQLRDITAMSNKVQLSAVSPCGGGVAFGGVEAGEEGVEAVFEPAAAAGAAQVRG